MLGTPAQSQDSSIRLNCLIEGESTVFTVTMSRDRLVSELKKEIKMEQALDTLKNPNALELWKPKDTNPIAVTPVDTLVGRITESMGEDPSKFADKLVPTYSLSRIFSIEPSNDHVHIIAKVPATIVKVPLTASFSTLKLFCYVRNDDHTHAFEVKIGMEESVAALKGAIKEKRKPDFDCVRADSLVLWNVNIPYDEDLNETVNKLGLVDKKTLLPIIRMSKIFPKQPEDGHIHLVVKELPVTIPQKRKLPEPSQNVLDRLKRSKVTTIAPSETGKSATYQSIQGHPSQRIFDDRPKPDADIPPVELLYEGFAHFRDIMNGHTAVPGLGDIDVQELHKHVDNLVSNMAGYFSDEDNRRDEALRHLNKIFSARKGTRIPRLHPAAIGTDGHYTEFHGLRAMIVEFKNELTGITSLPQIELVGYAARLTATRLEEVEDQLYLRWRIPFVGLTIIGRDITFYAIIGIDHQFRISQLTYPLSYITADPECRTDLYSAFTAASVLQARILQDIKKHLENPPAVIPPHLRRFPEVSKLRQYQPSGSDYFSFEIQAFFPDRQLCRYLYVAITSDGRRVLIKFSRQYSIELHAFCARSGHAPQIFAFEKLPGGWYAVAMEYIEYGLPITDPSLPSAHRQRWADELQRLTDGFHSEGFVHGDLRDANLLCNGDSVMLLDYDWGGKDGEAFYPTLNLNDELLHGRASNDLRITKDDDRRVLKNTLAKLVNRDR